LQKKINFIHKLPFSNCLPRYSELKANNNFIERRLKVAATTRIYNTIVKLAELGTE
jgi:hypothetical protein